jgi:O-antigen/teichoic acid export membrane protein
MSQSAQLASERRGLGANITALAGGQAVTWSMSLLWTLIVPRLLGPSGMGVLVTATSATAILGVILGLGARNYLVRELVADRQAASSIVGTALVLRGCMLPLYAVGVVLYGRYAHLNSQAMTVLYLVAATTMLVLLEEPIQATFQAIERMEYLALGDVFDRTTQSLVGIGLAVVGFGAVGLTTASLVITGLGMALYVRWIRRHVHIDLRTNVAKVRKLVRGSMPYWAFGVFFMTYLWIDAAMLAAMTRPEVVGWYGLPTKLFTTLMFAPAILSTAWLPRLVSAFEEDIKRLWVAAKAPTELVLVIGLPICVMTAMLSPWAIPLLFGNGYRNAVPVMIVLALCLPLMYLNIMLNQILIAAKRPMAWTWLMAGATVVNPILNYVLIRHFETVRHNGAIGAALALLLTELLIVVAGMVLVGRRVLDAGSLWRLTRAAVAAAGMLGVMEVLRPLGVAAAPGGVLAFVLLASVLRVASREEVEMLRSGFDKVRSRIRRRSEDSVRP